MLRLLHVFVSRPEAPQELRPNTRQIRHQHEPKCFPPGRTRRCRPASARKTSGSPCRGSRWRALGACGEWCAGCVFCFRQRGVRLVAAAILEDQIPVAAKLPKQIQGKTKTNEKPIKTNGKQRKPVFSYIFLGFLCFGPCYGTVSRGPGGSRELRKACRILVPTSLRGA